MPLSLFHRSSKTHFSAQSNEIDVYQHSFGGDPATFGLRFVGCKQPLHLLFRLNLADPAISIRLPGISWLPLCYGFGYAKFDGLCIYQVQSDSSVKLIFPEKPKFDPNFPFPKYPRSYPLANLRFTEAPYDPKKAEDALSLAAVFGVDELPPEEMDRAIKYVAENTDLIEMWCSETYGWEPAHVVQSMYPRPFIQGPPSLECENPNCTAEVVDHTRESSLDAAEIWSAEELEAFAEAGIDPTIRLPSRPIRRDSLTTFALYESEVRDSPVLDDIQLTFQLCDACLCITVRNQCS